MKKFYTATAFLFFTTVMLAPYRVEEKFGTYTNFAPVFAPPNRGQLMVSPLLLTWTGLAVLIFLVQRAASTPPTRSADNQTATRKKVWLALIAIFAGAIAIVVFVLYPPWSEKRRVEAINSSQAMWNKQNGDRIKLELKSIFKLNKTTAYGYPEQVNAFLVEFNNETGEKIAGAVVDLSVVNKGTDGEMLKERAFFKIDAFSAEYGTINVVQNGVESEFFKAIARITNSGWRWEVVAVVPEKHYGDIYSLYTIKSFWERGWAQTP